MHIPAAFSPGMGGALGILISGEIFVFISVLYNKKRPGRLPRPSVFKQNDRGCYAAAVNEFLGIYRLAIGAVREGLATKPDVLAGCCRFHSVMI